MSGIGYMNIDEDEDDSYDEDDLGIDDSLSPLQRLQKYCRSDLILHRLHLVRELSEIATQIGTEETIEHILPEMVNLKDDPEAVIRQALAEQLAEFSTFVFAAMGDEKKEIMQGTVQPVLEQLVFDEHSQVRASAATSLVELCKLLDKETLKSFLFPIIEKLASDKSDEEHRIEAGELLSGTAACLPQELVETFTVEQLQRLSADPMFRVRKAAAIALGNVCARVSQDVATATLLPIFVRLTSDEIWGVRKACSEAVIPVTTVVSAEGRMELAKIFSKLVVDSSRWVRNSAFQHLGQFIASLSGQDVPEDLLDYYKGMVQGNKSKFGDSDTVLFCAYSFPGVLVTVGAERWPMLRDIYLTLVKDLQVKVRRTLSYSLHEVAKILGTETTENELLETFELFLKDLDQVKVGVVRHFADFLAVLSPEKRQSYVSVLEDIQMSSVNWRFRKLLAKQLGQVASLFDEETVRMHIIPIVLQLFEDQVTAVRHATAAEIAGLIVHLQQREPSLLKELISDVCGFAEHKSCYGRQCFALACENIAQTMDDPALFKEHFWAKFYALKDDRVANIRIVVARALSRCILDKESYAPLHEEGNAALELFAKDRDREVRYFASRQPLDELPPVHVATTTTTEASGSSNAAPSGDQERPDEISA
eukprot:CAMPEP_0114617832 /NCGR_PEP_ID=MMETSP0168-20121206/7397_1 /TAXON_ID=95228 ORGANISM="Vannella sp., Strain DIVA3 517/6/12" /NCGR_SAMPLE_ID=MMETSP0168 /ASSEMBLY_ACC=CAM_ASM_000044 /LENGTH=650 /DNA_ID=CAMNT_0001828973 /DNA_START=214 /DNA_END=2166 /DNA_ORIENTATION=+